MGLTPGARKLGLTFQSNRRMKIIRHIDDSGEAGGNPEHTVAVVAGQKKARCDSGLESISRRRHGGDRCKYREAKVIKPILIGHMCYLPCEYEVIPVWKCCTWQIKIPSPCFLDTFGISTNTRGMKCTTSYSRPIAKTSAARVALLLQSCRFHNDAAHIPSHPGKY